MFTTLWANKYRMAHSENPEISRRNNSGNVTRDRQESARRWWLAEIFNRQEPKGTSFICPDSWSLSRRGCVSPSINPSGILGLCLHGPLRAHARPASSSLFHCQRLSLWPGLPPASPLRQSLTCLDDGMLRPQRNLPDSSSPLRTSTMSAALRLMWLRCQFGRHWTG
jgi:hypothetical protein